MTKFELSWRSKKYQNNNLFVENVEADCFEDVAETWFGRLKEIGLSNVDCWWKIVTKPMNHVCIEMNPGMKCLVRGW